MEQLYKRSVMMKQFIMPGLFTVLLLLLAACGSQEVKDQTGDTDEGAVTKPHVEVKFDEEPLPVNKETTIQAIVTQDGEEVTDAEKVEFEIWKKSDGQDTSEMIEAENQGNGAYAITYSFDSEGTYKVYAHTTANDVHVMPLVEVEVGKEHGKKGNTEEEHSDDHKHSEGKEYTVHFMNDAEFKTGKPSQLTAHIKHGEKPFTGAQVRFEISSYQMDKHEYVDAKEDEDGEYTGTYTFPSAGDYTVKVHYEKPKEDIHGHQESQVNVRK
ncbi:FixH family protein [Halobacillus salinarum]|uniref:FixH family protein n=1 Tax=Halobacillus salinarum TaxID=2932257 RepID=A0ABY4EIV3_9BACI|nr:FixH family protein [Halobacillus salinarum]UOQ43803.1 FixH family protein [Halobacillus salinarum]